MTDNPYGHGVSSGAIYPIESGGPVVSWPGLVSVDQKFSANREAMLFEGEVIYSTFRNSTRGFTVSAYSFPEELRQLTGYNGGRGGYENHMFNFIYKTVTNGAPCYKIHWGVSAKPTNLNYSTITTTKAPLLYSWECTEGYFAWLSPVFFKPFGHTVYFPPPAKVSQLDAMIKTGANSYYISTPANLIDFASS